MHDLLASVARIAAPIDDAPIAARRMEHHIKVAREAASRDGHVARRGQSELVNDLRPPHLAEHLRPRRCGVSVPVVTADGVAAVDLTAAGQVNRVVAAVGIAKNREIVTGKEGVAVPFPVINGVVSGGKAVRKDVADVGRAAKHTERNNRRDIKIQINVKKCACPIGINIGSGKRFPSTKVDVEQTLNKIARKSRIRAVVHGVDAPLRKNAQRKREAKKRYE